MPRFSKIDELTRRDHHWLTAEDRCAYIWEFYKDDRFEQGSTISLITNLKKPLTRKGTAEFSYKGPAIQECSAALAQVIKPDWLKQATLVPVPPSKAPDHPEYDDRMYQVCKGISSSQPVDVRNLVVQTESTEPFHFKSANRPSVEDLVAIYRIDEDIATPAPKRIGIVDDVLVAGTHFKAMQKVLSDRFPYAEIVGMFIARRKVRTPDFSDFGFVAID